MTISFGKATDGLLASAKRFISEALENYGERKPDFSILHAVTAAELVLKARLANINPALILEDIDAGGTKKFRTVSLRALPQRLANLGIPLRVEEKTLIDQMGDWRNQIVHHTPSYDPKAAEHQLPLLLNFLATTLRNEFEIPLETFLPKPLYKTAMRMLDDWERAVAEARDSAKAAGKVYTDSCPECEAAGVMAAAEGNEVLCHLCKTKFFRCDKCFLCEREITVSYEQNPRTAVCWHCVDEAGDWYIQNEVDIRRGK
jgi:HEPN domain-containing protein